MEGARAGSRFVVKTLGCKANFFDSSVLESKLEREGLERADTAPGAQDENRESVALCIVNSCTVTDEADRQSRREAKRLKKLYPNAKVVFTGCGAEVDPEKMLAQEGVDYVFGNQDKDALIREVLPRLGGSEPPRILGHVSSYDELRSQHPMDREWALPERLESLPEHARTRHFLKVQEGCDSFCTYCIIPYGRGPARSLRPREVIEDIRRALDSGVQEVILTGTNLGDFGSEWSKDAPRGLAFAELVSEVLAHTALPRLRTSSLDPTEIRPELMELMRRSPRLLPHFHVSLQSAVSPVLKRMKRGYRAEEVEACLNAIAGIRNPRGERPFVGMDVITGFPGETPELYEEGQARLSSLPWDRLHVFPYSERSGTPATRLDGAVPGSVRKERARALMSLSLDRLQRRYREALAQRQVTGVLWEGSVKGPDGRRGWVSGYTPEYLRVLAQEGPETRRNSIGEAPVRELYLDRAAGEVSLIADLNTRV